MSISNLKWVQGAPKELLPGMVVRSQGEVMLIGHFTDKAILRELEGDISEHAQAISEYEIDWLENMGVPAKAVK